MTIKRLLAHKNLYLFLALSWTTLVFFLCLVSSGSLPSISIKVAGFDKLVHFTFHFVFVILWFLYLKNRNIKPVIVKIFLASLCFGILIEICQSLFTTTRQADVLDVLANATGAITAITILFLYHKFLKKDIL
jgi:VanZ family protein